MSHTQQILEGCLYWCDTSRTNLPDRFSDKERRPVLVVAKIGDYAAIYPCSSLRANMGASEWVGDIFGNGDTFLVFGCGLFFAPLSDIDLPPTPWENWDTWKKSHREFLKTDLDSFRARHKETLRTPRAGQSHRPKDPQVTSLADLLKPEIRARWEEAQKTPTPPPKPLRPPPPPPRPRPKLSPQEEFRRAFEAIKPYEVLKEDAEPLPSDYLRSVRGKKRPK